MLRNLSQLIRYRSLIQSLVVRELKARYRGSVLGFFWSFINPLLLLTIYSFVFSVVLPGLHSKETEPYALFMFCGILPWTWFSSSLNEAAGSLISGGNGASGSHTRQRRSSGDDRRAVESEQRLEAAADRHRFRKGADRAAEITHPSPGGRAR